MQYSLVCATYRTVDVKTGVRTTLLQCSQKTSTLGLRISACNKTRYRSCSVRSVVKVVLWSRGAHLTKPGWSKPHTHSNPTNLALFRHKIARYRFNQGAHMGAGGLSPPPGPPHFNHCVRLWWIKSRVWRLLFQKHERKILSKSVQLKLLKSHGSEFRLSQHYVANQLTKLERVFLFRAIEQEVTLLQSWTTVDST